MGLLLGGCFLSGRTYTYTVMGFLSLAPFWYVISSVGLTLYVQALKRVSGRW